MKKKLEGELISIAHRVLKLKNRSETVILQTEAKKIYEQLTILRFYEENFEVLKADISPDQFEEKLLQKEVVEVVEKSDFQTQSQIITENSIENIESTNTVVVVEQTDEENIEGKKNIITTTPIIVTDDKEFVSTTISQDLVVSEVINDQIATAEEISKIVAEMTANKEVIKPKEPQQFSMEDLLGDTYTEPEFIRIEESLKVVEQKEDHVFENTLKEDITNQIITDLDNKQNSLITDNIEKQEQKAVSLNDRLNSGITFGLNDRIAFEKKLFSGSSDDFNRVISQLNTFDSFDEAKGFIASFVKPDYNNWDGQEEYETRFLEIIEKKFS